MSFPSRLQAQRGKANRLRLSDIHSDDSFGEKSHPGIDLSFEPAAFNDTVSEASTEEAVDDFAHFRQLEQPLSPDSQKAEAFLSLLITVTEQHVCVQQLEGMEKEFTNGFMSYQNEIQVHLEKAERYAALKEPALDMIIERHRGLALRPDIRGNVEHYRDRLDQAQSSLLRLRAKLKTDLWKLYHGFNDFMGYLYDHDSEVAGVRLPPEFGEDLKQVIDGTETLEGMEAEFAKKRTDFISASKTYQQPVSSVVRTTARRKRVRSSCTDYKNWQKTIVRQKQSQSKRENGFFLELMQPFFEEAAIVPAQHSPVESSVHGDITYTAAQPLDEQPVVEEHEHYTTEFRMLLNARQQLAHRQSCLQQLREAYSEELGSMLSIYPGLTKSQYDDDYIEQHGSSLEQREAYAKQKLGRAEEKYAEAFAMAEAAHIAELPPSPASLASQNGDGHSWSQNPAAIEKRTKAAPARDRKIRKWNRSVVLAGQPSPPRTLHRRESYPGDRPGSRKGIIQSTYGSGDEAPDTSKLRVRRARRRKIESKKDFVRQRDALVEAAEERRRVDLVQAPQPEIRQGWRCVIQ